MTVTSARTLGSQRRETMALLLLSVNAVIAGASGVFAKSLLEADWSVAAVNLLRLTLAGGLLLPCTFWVVRRRGVNIRSQASGIVILGVIGIAGMLVCYYNALSTLPVGVALLLISLSPVLVLLWVWVRHGVRPGRLTTFGATAALVGLGMIVSAIDVGTPSVGGVAWGLAGACCVASYYIASEHVTTEVPPVVLACGGLLVAAAAMGLLTLAGLLSVHAGAGYVTLGERSVSALIPLLVLACLSTAIVFVVSFFAVEVLGARMASFFSLCEPVAAFLIAWALLSETPVPIQLGGGALMLCGVAVICQDASGRIRRAVKADDSTDLFLPHPG